jgi:thiamine biosynthesis lipoprotein
MRAKPTPARFIRLLMWLACVAVGNAAGASEPRLERYEQIQPHMGTQFAIALYAPDEATAKQAFDAAFARIGALDDCMSDYDVTSELSRLGQASPTEKPIPVSDDLWRVLSASQTLSERTRGAFDVTVGPLTQLWRRSRRQKELPAPERLQAARAAVGYQHLRLRQDAQSVELLRPGMRLDLGAIAKGYACDEALKAMAAKGVTRAIVNGGGGLAVSAAPPGEQGWKVGVAPLEPEAEPSRVLLLENAGVATSGDAWQYVEIDGVRYSHIIDSKTGLGLTERSSVTVVAPTGILADGLATSVSVLGREAGLRLIEETPHAAALMVWLEDGQTKTAQSARFGELPVAKSP